MIAVFVWEYPIIVGSIVVALGAIGKFVHVLYKWAKGIEATIDYVATEMHFNGGATMRDAIKRIEARQVELEIAHKKELEQP